MSYAISGPAVTDAPALHPYLLHPRTGEPLAALGVTRTGRPIWPVLGGSQPTGEPAQQPPAQAPSAHPVPTPPPVLPPPVAPPAQPHTPPAQPPHSPHQGQPPAQPANAPVNPGVPWRELPIEDQVEYWRSQSRRHESRHLEALGLSPGELDRLRTTAAEHQRHVQANQTEQQRALTEAEQRGRQAAMQDVGGRLVDAYMRVAIGNRLGPDQVSGLLGSLDLRRFQTESGEVDTERVSQFVSTILPQAAPPLPGVPAGQPVPVQQPGLAPGIPVVGYQPQQVGWVDPQQAGAYAQPAYFPYQQQPAGMVGTPGVPVTGAPARQAPDMGQGSHQVARPSGLSAGREIARARFASQVTPQQQAPQQ